VLTNSYVASENYIHILQAVPNSVLLDKLLTRCHTLLLPACMFSMVSHRTFTTQFAANIYRLHASELRGTSYIHIYIYISAENRIWYVLNRTMMEYKYCCLVGLTRSISLRVRYSNDMSHPKQHDCVRYCWKSYIPRELLGNNFPLCCLRFIILINMAKVFIFFHKFRICLMKI